MLLPIGAVMAAARVAKKTTKSQGGTRAKPSASKATPKQKPSAAKSAAKKATGTKDLTGTMAYAQAIGWVLHGKQVDVVRFCPVCTQSRPVKVGGTRRPYVHDTRRKDPVTGQAIDPTNCKPMAVKVAKTIERAGKAEHLHAAWAAARGQKVSPVAQPRPPLPDDEDNMFRAAWAQDLAWFVQWVTAQIPNRPFGAPAPPPGPRLADAIGKALSGGDADRVRAGVEAAVRFARRAQHDPKWKDLPGKNPSIR